MKTPINQTEIDRLCSAYSKTQDDYLGASSRRSKIKNLLDAEFAKLKTLFRRRLSRAVKWPTATVSRQRVWVSFDHSKLPVTVTPIASASISARKGVTIELSFVATVENIEAECAALAAALSFWNPKK